MSDTKEPRQFRPLPPDQRSVSQLAATADAHAQWLNALAKVLPATVTINTPQELADYVRFLQTRNNQLSTSVNDLTRSVTKYKNSLKAAVSIQSELVND